jgi:hypothetical protein
LAAPIKYEMDKAAGTLVVDRFLHTPMRYPGNYASGSGRQYTADRPRLFGMLDLAQGLEGTDMLSLLRIEATPRPILAVLTER